MDRKLPFLPLYLLCLMVDKIMYDATFNVKIITHCLVIVCILCPSFIFLHIFAQLHICIFCVLLCYAIGGQL